MRSNWTLQMREADCNGFVSEGVYSGGLKKTMLEY
jgi:hypothetical protein